MDDASHVDGFSIALSDPPFSPWMRLAHVWRVAAASNLSGETGLRRLLDWEIFFQIDGQARFVVPAAGGYLDLPTDHLALIPPGLVHGWQALTPGAHIAVHFDLHAQTGIEAMEMIEGIEHQAAGQRWTAGVTPCIWGVSCSRYRDHCPDQRRGVAHRLLPLTRIYARNDHRRHVLAERRCNHYQSGW